VLYCLLSYMHSHMSSSYREIGSVGLGLCASCVCFYVFFLTRVKFVCHKVSCVVFTILLFGHWLLSCLERLVPEMTYYVLSGTLNSTHSLTSLFCRSLLLSQRQFCIRAFSVLSLFCCFISVLITCVHGLEELCLWNDLCGSDEESK